MAAPPIGNVQITVVDQGSNAALAVPLAQIQLKIGCCIAAGSAATPTILATTSPATLQSNLIGGPLMEAAGLVCEAGSVALVVTCPIAVNGTATAVTANSNNGGNAAITVSTDAVFGAWDTYYVQVVCTKAGTIGSGSGPSLQISLDAGRNFGVPFSLGTATSYGIGQTLNNRVAGGTGLQLNFTGAQTMNLGDSWQFSTTGPNWNDAGVQAAWNKYLASQYAIAGVGSTHIVGTAASGDITNFQTYLQSGVAGFIFPRALVELRDALAPVAWGGSGETEATWMAALETTASGLTAQSRVCAGGGQYNTPSPYPAVNGGTFSYRRPGTWSQAVLRTLIGLSTRASAVINGAYSTIAVNPATDPLDGFIYHDERINPGLNTARIAALQTWPKQGAGFFQCQEPLLSPISSQYTELVIGNVVDAACDICYAVGLPIVNSALIVQANGTLDPTVRNNLQAKIQNALQQGLIGPTPPLASKVIAQISSSWNVLSTGLVPVVVTVTPVGYADAISFTINLNTAGM